MFNKKRLSARKKPSPIIMNTIGTIGVVLVFFLALTSISLVSSKNFDVYKTFSGGKVFSKSPVVSEEELEAKKVLENQKKLLEQKFLEDEQKVNTLIIGRGGVKNDAPELTDSIILMSFHKKKNHISMLSIPRDLYVNYGDIDKNGKEVKGKINGLYVHFLAKYQNEEQAIQKLQEVIESISGETIDHYVNIDFTGFIKLIDALGGVKITVPETLIDRQYPDNNHGYQTFYLKKGTWILDGKVALKYVRTRKNTGGDFGRSQRQQQVIGAIKAGILNDGYLKSPSNIKELYSIVSENLSTDLGILEAVKLITDIKLQDNTHVYSSGLTATCLKPLECDKGGYLYYPQRVFFDGLSVVLLEANTLNSIDDFSGIEDYTNILFNSPSLLEEAHKISIFSKDSEKAELKDLKMKLRKLGFNISMQEIIGRIPEPSISKESSIDEIDTALNLDEYNEKKKDLKEEEDIPISREFANTSTKIITNGVLSTSPTLEKLQEILGVDDVNIIRNPDNPKYAKDPNTKIEILYIAKDKDRD